MNRFALLALALVPLAGCQAPPPPAASTTTTTNANANANANASVDTHEAMVRWINPAAMAIWDVGNNAMGETGGLDPALMDEAAWTKLADAAQLLERHSREMADAQRLHVGAHNDEIEGFATRAEIQALIDADPAGFRRLSQEMADHAGELAAAARARDIQRSGDLSESLSEQCQACHSLYWEKPT